MCLQEMTGPSPYSTMPYCSMETVVGDLELDQTLISIQTEKRMEMESKR